MQKFAVIKVFILLFIYCGGSKAENGAVEKDNPIIIRTLARSYEQWGGGGSKAENGAVEKDKPIIIRTLARSYEQPSIKEYEECHQNRDHCLRVCESDRRPDNCKNECLVCPILIDQDILIQGINDTLYQAHTQNTINTTNIIRLTNEIRNVISTFMGNISAINDNKVNIYQNSSSSGGKYGVGYNKDGDCCYVVHPNKSCTKTHMTGAIHCVHKRHRMCSDKCKSRTMYAKKMRKCDSMENCKTEINYTVDPPQSRPKCIYSEQWPLINSQDSNKRPSTICSRCLEIPYGYILHHGIPHQCRGCRRGVMHSQRVLPSPYYYSYTYNPYMNYQPISSPPTQFFDPHYMPSYDFFQGDTFLDSKQIDGWNIVSQKCQNEDGTISDCEERDDRTVNNPIDKTTDEDYYEDVNLEEDELAEPSEDSQFNRFRRSSYSKRNN